MSEKTFNNIRIFLKHDIEANWLQAVNFAPKKGELIIYDPDEFCSHSRFKIGDGVTNVNELAFGDVNRHDTEANWLTKDYIPQKGQVIIYDSDESCPYARFKIGDGTTNVNDLPFGDDAKVDIYQGEEHAGRILYVNDEGDVDITDAPEIMDIAYHEEERILEFVSKPQLPGNTSVDSSLTKAGDAADAKTVGDRLKELENRPAGGGGTISNVELLFTDDGEGNVVISISTDNPEEDDGAFDGGEIIG